MYFNEKRSHTNRCYARQRWSDLNRRKKQQQNLRGENERERKMLESQLVRTIDLFIGLKHSKYNELHIQLANWSVLIRNKHCNNHKECQAF